MQPKVWLDSITFSDGSKLSLGKDDIILLVGPNNSGKTESLRAIREKVRSSSYTSPVLSELSLEREGSAEDLINWLEQTTKTNFEHSHEDPRFELLGVSIHRSHAHGLWPQRDLGPLARFFCHMLTADERLRVADAAPAIPLVRESPSHPVHFLQRDDHLEARLSRHFRKAFGVDLIVHRNAGSQVPLYVGDRPMPKENQDRTSYDYIKELERLPLLQTQGDGMRSFTGALLETSVGTENILLIDEPEAFLHPPQARLLGSMLVSEKPKERQLLLATHSGDLLRGVLDGDSKHVRVVRIRREGQVNTIKQLDNARIQELWADPLLRYSNILDGLFHEAVVVTESDSDAKFYAAISDTIHESRSSTIRKPDVMFTHGGGKARVPMIVKSLRELGVPVTTVVDFDILQDRQPLESLVEASGGDWAVVENDWRALKSAVDSKKPELTSDEVMTELRKILDEFEANRLLSHLRGQIDHVLRRASAWAQAKTGGRAFIPSGTPAQACDRLLYKLRSFGIFVVEIGELEGFVRSVGGHGPKWVNEVLRRNLREDPELKEARTFVSALLGQPAT